MCSICNDSPCAFGCPNYRQEGRYICADCQDGISNGESYYKIGTSYFHRECLLDSHDKEEILLLFGAKACVVSNGLAVIGVGEINEKSN